MSEVIEIRKKWRQTDKTTLYLHIFDVRNGHDRCPLYSVQKAGRLLAEPAMTE